MKKEQNKVTMEQIKKIAEAKKAEVAHLTYNVGDEVIDIEVKPYLPFGERCVMVHSIAQMVFRQDENGETVYAPYMLSLAQAYNLLAFYTNIALSADADAVWAFCLKTKCIDDILAVIDDEDVVRIYAEANTLIEYMKAQMLKKSKADELAGTISGWLETLRTKFDGVFDEKAVSDALETIKNAPDLRSPDLVKEILKARGGFDTNGNNGK